MVALRAGVAAGAMGLSAASAPGWAEQDGQKLIERTTAACADALLRAGIGPHDVAAVGSSTQRTIAGPVDRSRGLLRPLILRQDTRSAKEVAGMCEHIAADACRAITAIPPGPGLIAFRLLWMRKHEPSINEAACKVTQNQDLILRAIGVDGYFWHRPVMASGGAGNARRCAQSDRLTRLFDISPGLFAAPTRRGTRMGTVSASGPGHGFLPRSRPSASAPTTKSCAVVAMTGASAYEWLLRTLGLPELEMQNRKGGSAHDILNEVEAQTRPAAGACCSTRSSAARAPLT